MAILLHEEGLYDRCRIYATDMNERSCSRPGTASSRWRRCRSTRATTGRPAARRRSRTTTRRRTAARIFRAVAAGEHRLLAAQPGDRRLVQRVQRDPLPQRDDLLQQAAAGPRARPALRQPGDVRVPRPGQPRSRSASRRTSTTTRRSTAERSSTGGSGLMASRGLSSWSVGTRWAACAALRGDAGRASRAASRCRSPWCSTATDDAGGLLERRWPASAPLPVREPEDKEAIRARARLPGPGRLSPAGRAEPVRALDRGAGRPTRGRRSTCSSNRRPMPIGERAVGGGADRGRAATGPGAPACIKARGGLVVVQEPDDGRAPAMPGAALAAAPSDQVLPLARDRPVPGRVCAPRSRG